jgi:hypothetical protein
MPARLSLSVTAGPYNKKREDFVDFCIAKTYVKGSYRIIPGSPCTTGSDHNPVAVSFRLE